MKRPAIVALSCVLLAACSSSTTSSAPSTFVLTPTTSASGSTTTTQPSRASSSLSLLLPGFEAVPSRLPVLVPGAGASELTERQLQPTERVPNATGGWRRTWQVTLNDRPAGMLTVDIMGFKESKDATLARTPIVVSRGGDPGSDAVLQVVDRPENPENRRYAIFAVIPVERKSSVAYVVFLEAPSVTDEMKQVVMKLAEATAAIPPADFVLK